eukprot:jgi/Botrbrau1/7132/Bobra.0143s0012.1
MFEHKSEAHLTSGLSNKRRALHGAVPPRTTVRAQHALFSQLSMSTQNSRERPSDLRKTQFPSKGDLLQELPQSRPVPASSVHGHGYHTQETKVNIFLPSSGFRPFFQPIGKRS